MIMAITIVISTLIVASIISILLTPIILWSFFKGLGVISHLLYKITDTEHKKVERSQYQVNKVKLSNYGFNFGPLKIGINKPIYKGYITYLRNSGKDDFNNCGFYMVFKPLTKYIGYPIYKATSHIVCIISRIKRWFNQMQIKPFVECAYFKGYN